MPLLRNTSNGAVVEWDAERARNPQYVEMSPEEVSAYFASPAMNVVMRRPGNPGDGITFHLSARGIGDAVCGLYAACGLAQAGHKVTFLTRFPEFMPSSRIFQQGLTIAMQHEDIGANASTNWTVDLEEGYEGKLKSRVHGYIRNIARGYGIEPVEPARPEAVRRPQRPKVAPYVLLAPFVHHANRKWPLPHWARLATLLQNAGHKVIIIGMEPDEADCRAWFAPVGFEYRLGLRADALIETIEDATVMVGNDSGPMHLAGLYGTPTFALFAQLRPDYLLQCAPTVTPVTPADSVKCKGCFWTQRGGNRPACASACSALYTIDPHLVADKVIATLRQRKK